MTGIERLREWADGYAELGKDHTTIDVVPSGMATLLSSIADQIERERVSRMRVLSVVTEMERHILGHEGAEDSPVARWARELREALGGDGRKPANYASISAYDLRPEEDREAIAWVRERGGLDAVKRRWECLSYYADPVPRACMEKRLARLQRQIDESHAALRRRREVISELNHRACDLTRKCAERGETIRELSGKVAKQSDELRVMRDVIAETCARLGVEGTGSTVDDAQVIWREISRRLMPANLTHRAPVLAADGRPLEVGQTVWGAKGGSYHLTSVHDGKVFARYGGGSFGAEVESAGGEGLYRLRADQLTHERPVADTWERLQEDAGCTATKYNERRGTIFTTKQQVARDLVRRAKKLAGVSE